MKHLRILFLATLIFTSLNSKASHIIGSHFQFEFVSADTTANTKTYKIILYLYRDPQGITLPTSRTIYYQKNPTTSNWLVTSLTQDSTWSESVGCGATGTVEVYRYSKNITTDWNGAYSVMFYECCRSNMVGNLNNASSAGHKAISTLVVGKPVRGHNSSPLANYSPKSIPVGASATFQMSAADPDGDSLSYNIVPCREGSPLTYNDIAFATGYSITAPFGPSGSLSMDTAAGTITVQSAIQQVCALNIEIVEWAKDTAGVWRVMGKTEHDHLIHFTAPVSPVGSANILAASTPNNEPSDSLWVQLDFNAFPSMFDLDSVQFQLINNLNPATVVAVSQPNSLSELLVRTDVPLSAGIWSLAIGYSNDSIALTGSCGAPLVDTVDFYVQIPVNQIAFTGPDSAYVTTQLDYYFSSGMEWIDSVQYTVTNGYLWTPTTNPYDTISITWTLPPANLSAIAYVGDTSLTFNIAVGVYGIGLEETAPLSGLRVAPNPTRDLLVLTGVQGEMNLVVRNLAGQEVLNLSTASGQPVNVSALPAGTYVLTVIQDQHQTTRLLVKE